MEVRIVRAGRPQAARGVPAARPGVHGVVGGGPRRSLPTEEKRDGGQDELGHLVLLLSLRGEGAFCLPAFVTCQGPEKASYLNNAVTSATTRATRPLLATPSSSDRTVRAKRAFRRLCSTSSRIRATRSLPSPWSNSV